MKDIQVPTRRPGYDVARRRVKAGLDLTVLALGRLGVRVHVSVAVASRDQQLLLRQGLVHKINNPDQCLFV